VGVWYPFKLKSAEKTLLVCPNKLLLLFPLPLEVVPICEVDAFCDAILLVILEFVGEELDRNKNSRMSAILANMFNNIRERIAENLWSCPLMTKSWFHGWWFLYSALEESTRRRKSRSSCKKSWTFDQNESPKIPLPGDGGPTADKDKDWDKLLGGTKSSWPADMVLIMAVANDAISS
jgi:hypothetical protein